MEKSFSINTKITKVDSDLGLVMGWGIICTKAGEPYFDKQEGNVTEKCMLNSATDFMMNSREVKDMHKGEPLDGSIVFAMPLTQEIADSYELVTKQTGLMIIMKTDDKDVLEMYRTGERTGFSIGGFIVEAEEVS